MLAAYLLGSISFGLIAAARRGVDLRSFGSGNTGATNVGRALGRREGRVVLLLDAAKGLLPTLAGATALGVEDPWTAGAGVAAVAGHCWPVWHGFRGGKGAATAAGAMLVLCWPAGLGAIVTYLGAKKVSRKVSVGSLAGATVGALLAALVAGTTAPAAGALGIAALVWIRHADNLARLARGDEPDA